MDEEQDICAQIRAVEDTLAHAVTPYCISYGDLLWKLVELRHKLWWELEERRRFE